MDKPDTKLQSLSPLLEKVEALSRIQRVAIYCGTILLIVGVFIFFSYRPKIKVIAQLKSDYSKLEKQLNTAKRNARELKTYEARYKAAQKQLKIARRALPKSREIPSLLASISESGQEAGMQFLLFQPRSENKKEFYSEIPVSIKIRGNYHNIVTFFDKIATLPRIVNVRNINLGIPKKGSRLNASCTAVTYKFVEAKPKPKKKSKKKKRRRRK